MMAEARVRALLIAALKEMGVEDTQIYMERPRDSQHGDFATNVAMTLSSTLQKPPRAIAEEIASRIPSGAGGVRKVEVAGPGFLNFHLSGEAISAILDQIVEEEGRFGRSSSGEGKLVLVEFVSANPTGLLHLGHGRQAALGDAIASLLIWTGWQVYREFYYNDAGAQIDRLAESVLARYREHFGREVDFPEDGYKGAIIVEIAQDLATADGDQWIEASESVALERVRNFAVARLRLEQDRDLLAFGVNFDNYYLESSLYENGRVDETTARLRETGLVFDSEGAVWLRTTAFGDQKDRVMIRTDGTPTYFLPDVAYHITKWERGFHRAINIQGSDHHGTMARVRAGLRALGLPASYPEYVLHQMVTVEKDGKEVKFSKRAGDTVSLRDLIEEVGADVTRYFFLMRKPDGHLVFDLNQALDESDRNPVFKVKYAHARICSIFRKAGIARSEVSMGYGDPSLLLDEMFEILTLRQTRKAPLIPVVLFDEPYWRSVINFDKLVEHGAIDAADLTLFRFADTAEATWDALVEQGLGKAHDDSAPDVVQKDI
jgi:arginyl-tRNA synthetase